MLFDEDTTLLSFFENFAHPEDEQELIANIIKYVGGGNFGASMCSEEGDTNKSTGESLDDVSSYLCLFKMRIFPSLNVRQLN